MKYNNIYSGLIGAVIFLFIILVFLVWLKPFNYQAIYIVRPETKLIQTVANDTSKCTHFEAIKDLEKKGLLLTPDEYTSHISDYYNTLIAFLIGLFVVFTIGSFYGIRFTSKKELEEAKEILKLELEKTIKEDLKESKSFNSSLVNEILSRIEDDIVTKTDKDTINESIDNFNSEISKLKKDIDCLYNLEPIAAEIDKNSATNVII